MTKIFCYQNLIVSPNSNKHTSRAYYCILVEWSCTIRIDNEVANNTFKIAKY